MIKHHGETFFSCLCAGLFALGAAFSTGCGSAHVEDDGGGTGRGGAPGAAEFGKNLRPVVHGVKASTATLEERMAFYRVPGVSIAVIEDGKVLWTRAFGVVEGGGAPVDEKTIFQVASNSKTFTALAAMALVKDGRLDLDADVNGYLEGWQIPPNEFNNRVTLRQLLSHTSGLGEYTAPGRLPSEAKPTLLQVLNGEAPAKTEPARVKHAPGTFDYSNLGYILVQKIVEDVSGQDFATFVKARVLDPMGMASSTFAWPGLPALRASAARGHENGVELKEGWLDSSPALGHAGLWSNPADMSRFILHVQETLAGRGDAPVVSRATLEAMITPAAELPGSSAEAPANMGLGFFLDGEGETLRFKHDGANKGFRSTYMGYVEKGRGASVMANGDEEAYYLNLEIYQAIAEAYGWAGHQAPTPLVIGDVAPGGLGKYEGVYALDEPAGAAVEIEQREDRLFARIAAIDPDRWFWCLPHPTNADEFSTLVDQGASLKFAAGASGGVDALTISMFGVGPFHGTKSE